MTSILEKLMVQLAIVKQTPVPFFTAIILMTALVYQFVKSQFTTKIQNLESKIQQLESRIQLRDDQLTRLKETRGASGTGMVSMGEASNQESPTTTDDENSEHEDVSQRANIRLIRAPDAWHSASELFLTAEHIMEIYGSRSSVQADKIMGMYKGYKAVVRGSVQDVTTILGTPNVQLSLGHLITVILEFEDEGERVLNLRRGDVIESSGEVCRADEFTIEIVKSKLLSVRPRGSD